MKVFIARRDRNYLITKSISNPLQITVLVRTANNELPNFRGPHPGILNVTRSLSSWVDDCIKQDSAYSNEMFARWFGVPNAFFMPEAQYLQSAFPERWTTLINDAGPVGIDGDVKIMAMLRILRKDNSCAVVHDAARIGEAMARQYLHN